MRAVSLIGTSSGSPYTAAVEENTSLRTPALRIADTSSSEPATLLRQYFSGSATDSPTCEDAAKCSTPSKDASSTSAASWIRPRTNSAPSGTPSAKPVDRSSSTVTRWPASSRCAATTLPT